MMKKRKPTNSDALTDAPRSDEASLVAWEQNPQAQALRVDLQSGVFCFAVQPIRIRTFCTRSGFRNAPRFVRHARCSRYRSQFARTRTRVAKAHGGLDQRNAGAICRTLRKRLRLHRAHRNRRSQRGRCAAWLSASVVPAAATSPARPAHPSGSALAGGVVKNSQSYSSRRETTAVAGLKCETGCTLQQ